MAGIVFFGTPEFAVPSLEALAAAGLAPTLVVTRPDRPIGRGRVVDSPPVAKRAHELGLAVAQPERLRDSGFMSWLADLAPDLAVVVAYGRIFPADLLVLPRRGCLNVHASLLPRHRGASPIQAAILAGDTNTGVTIMKMAEGLDTGPILAQLATTLDPAETTAELSSRLAVLGADLLVQTVPGWLAGTTSAREQDSAGVTVAPLVHKADGVVDWREPAALLARRLRAYTPWPGLTATLAGEPVRLLAATPSLEVDHETTPGSILSVAGEALLVAAGSGSVLVVQGLQRPGRRALSGRDFANGERLGPNAGFEVA